MKKTIITAMVITLWQGTTFAQISGKTRFELELDPIAYALKGYSVHGVLVHQNLRFDAGVFAIQQPNGYSGNEGFSTYSSGFGFKLNYLLNQNQTWFAGVGLGFTTNDITLDLTGEKAKQRVIGLGIHAGYRWFMFKKLNGLYKSLYIAPWASVDFNKADKEINLGGKTYTQSKFSIFPTIHIGYKF